MRNSPIWHLFTKLNGDIVFFLSFDVFFLFCSSINAKEKCMLNAVQLQSIKPSFEFFCWFVCVKHKIEAFIPHLNHWNWKDIDFFVSNSVNIVRPNIECFGFNRSNAYELFRFYCFESVWKLSFEILLSVRFQRHSHECGVA